MFNVSRLTLINNNFAILRFQELLLKFSAIVLRTIIHKN